MAFSLYNPKSTPYAVDAIGYDITMNEVPVGDGEIEDGAVIPPKTERTVEVETVVRNEELDAWWVSHLERNQVTGPRIDVYAELDLGPAGPVRVPLDALTYTETIETDIFGNKDAIGPTSTETPGGATPTSGADAPATTTTGDDGSTTTAGDTSPSPTEAPTTVIPTPSETDDGLLG